MNEKPVNVPSCWEQIYQAGEAGWDLGGPTPVFKRLVESRRFPPGRMIVPGAGPGHDARLFARHGFAVTAVDFAEDAARYMRAQADSNAPIEILRADIFDFPRAFDHAFDYVLEYTCFCAIDPARRPEYADVVTRLLAPGGHLVALAFPLRHQSDGPPFGVSPGEYETLFGARGFSLIHSETPPDSVPQRKGFEELLIFRAREENRSEE